MKTMIAFVVCSLAGLVFAVPQVSDVTLAQGGVDRRVTVTYTLANAPAIVTVDFLTNGVSIGEANFANVWGDVNRRIEVAGTYTLDWRPDREWEGNLSGLTARVTAWDPSNPPDYVVVGLEAPNDVRFYVSTNALPDGGLTNPNYRRRKMVMRRIPAKGVTWRMGAPADEPGNYTKDGVTPDMAPNTQTPHLVTLTNDYYMAIYELTQRQFMSVCGWEETNPSYYNSTRVADWDEHPLESIVYSKVRGTSWPAGGHADAGTGTFVAALRARTGVEFDLPTEAQWEYACRAGTSTGINNGLELTYMNSSGALDPVGWHYKKDGAETKCVGRLAPNAWGLYDMHGNVYEYCLDRCNKDAMAMSSDPVTDPMGPTTGDQRIMRGGCIESPAYQCRSAYRRACDNTTGSNVRGFRLVCPISSNLIGNP